MYAQIGPVCDLVSDPDNFVAIMIEELDRLGHNREVVFKLRTMYLYSISGSFAMITTCHHLLNAHAMPGCYFGLNPEQTHYGFWPLQDLAGYIQHNDGIITNDLLEIPEGHRGPVLYVESDKVSFLVPTSVPQGTASTVVFTTMWTANAG